MLGKDLSGVRLKAAGCNQSSAAAERRRRRRSEQFCFLFISVWEKKKKLISRNNTSGRFLINDPNSLQM